MREIRIPNKFLNKLEDDYKSECQNIFLKYKDFLLEQMPLFSEYTDHSEKHIQFVLETAENLITERCWNVLTEEDIFVLLLSILFHDLGMHISIEGFKTLLNKNNIIKDYDTKTWKEEWEEYIDNVKKYDEEKQRKYFNRTYSNLEEKKEFNILGEEEIALIGGFIREQHGRLAHEISVYGFPLADGEFENYKEKRHHHIYDLAGFIARSHSIELRETYPYLQSKYFDVWKRPFKAHSIFLMVVLRISDYLHITSDRVNPYKLKLFKFKNEISILEFKKHLSVYDIQQVIDNPENLFVTCNPDELRIYLGMEKLIGSIQKELDNSWAVLGEVYGISNLGITIRRIDSNIYKKQWLENSTYVPENIIFKLDTRLKDLLIEPLYGDNPSYGIRELIQNSVDACKTRKIHNPNITIKLDKDYLIINDNGIGMSIDVIKNYFLSVGSPFLESSHWKEANSDNTIIRNGRFGIGVLASFLLGDTIEVITYKDTKEGDNKNTYGYQFKIYKNKSEIEIYKKRYEDIKDVIWDRAGTQIMIKLRDNVKSNIVSKNIIMDEWYKLDDINFEISIDNYDKDTNKAKLDDLNWNKLECDEFNDVRWSYKYKINSLKWQSDKDSDYKPNLNPNLLCNGIIIPEKYDSNLQNLFIKRWPTIHIIDKEGKLKLDLSRYKLTEPLPFLKQLEEELLAEFFDELKDIKTLKKLNGKVTISLREIVTENFKTQKLMFFKDGYTLYNSYIVEKIKPKRLVEIWANSIDLKHLDDDTAYVLHGFKNHPNLKYDLYNTNMYNTNVYMPSNAYETYMNDNSSYYKFRKEYKAEIKRANAISNIGEFTAILNEDSLVDKKVFLENYVALIVEKYLSNDRQYFSNSEKEIIDKYIVDNYIYPYKNEEKPNEEFIIEEKIFEVS